MVSGLEGGGKQRVFRDGSMCPASSACVLWRFIVIVGGARMEVRGPHLLSICTTTWRL